MKPNLVNCNKICKMQSKELSHKLWFSITYIFATQLRRLLILQTVNSIRSNSLSLKYQGFPVSGCQDIRIRKFEFVEKLNFFSKLQ